MHTWRVNAPQARLDPRQMRTHETVHRAALEVLRREGIGGTTMDAIAAEAGVARSTLYRNWGSRNEILAAAIDSAAGAPPSLTDGPVIDQLDAVVVGLVSGLDASEWGRALPAIVAAIAAEPELAEHYERFTESRRTGALRIVRRGVQQGELPADLPLDDFVDALVGPLFYRRLVRGRITTPAWARRHLARTFVAFGTMNAARRS